MKNRKFMTQAVLLTLLAVVGTFQACGQGQLGKTQGSANDGSFDAPSVADQGSMVNVGGTMISAEALKTTGVNYSENILANMVSVSGIGRPSQRTLTAYTNEIGKISDSGAAASVNAPMWLAVTNLAGEVCLDLVTAEKALAAGSRRVFGQVNFSAGPDQISDSAKDDVIRRLARSVWARNETAGELSMIKTSLNGAMSGRTAAADTDRAMLYVCSAMLASLDAQDR